MDSIKPACERGTNSPKIRRIKQLLWNHEITGEVLDCGSLLAESAAKGEAGAQTIPLSGTGK